MDENMRSDKETSGWFHGLFDIALRSSQRGACNTKSKVIAINALPTP